MLRVIRSGWQSAKANMALDATLLETLSPNGLTLFHSYRWLGPCASYGYFFRLDQEIDTALAAARGICLTRRVTGGGLLFHNCDWSFSLFVPRLSPLYLESTLESYRLINSLLARAIGAVLFEGSHLLSSHDDKQSAKPYCMSAPTIYDLTYKGKKIAGAAQRKTKNGILHHGSVSLALPPQWQLDIIKDDSIARAIKQSSFHMGTLGEPELEELRSHLEHALCKELMNTLSLFGKKLPVDAHTSR